AFLWGPIGLVLSAPLTVCLVVLGKYVPQLECLYILLGDRPVLSASARFYQRLLACDTDEARALIHQQVKAANPERVYDELFLPAFRQVRLDHKAGHLSDSHRDCVLGTLQSLLRSGDTPAGKSASLPAPNGQLPEGKLRLLACP